MRKYLPLGAVALLLLFTLGCGGMLARDAFQPVDLNPEWGTGRWVKKVDQFAVILDSSMSMAGDCRAQGKFDRAHALVGRLNQTIPEMELTSELRTFGAGTRRFGTRNLLVYGPKPYSSDEFAAALDTIRWAGGESPLDKAIEDACADFASSEGRTAVIIFSDGELMDDAPKNAARKMAAQFGDRLCFHTVFVGNSYNGKILMDEIAAEGNCGSSVNAADIASPEGMADFVRSVFFDDSGIMDSDGDGVPDHLDQCPGTPKGVRVDSKGCPIEPRDSDGDGVIDDKDECPGTPKGARVDERGCWVVENVFFDTDKSKIKPQGFKVLDEVVPVLEQNPDLKVEVQGHADIRGTEEYNRKLSLRRANAVRAYLVKKGVDAERLTVVGYGFSKPAAPNDTKEGMAKNRRVEFMPLP